MLNAISLRSVKWQSHRRKAGAVGASSIPQTPWMHSLIDKSAQIRPRSEALSIKLCSLLFALSSEVLGYHLLSTKKREKGKLSREGGINGFEGKCFVGLCRQSPFTAFTSEATFAVTDEYPLTGKRRCESAERWQKRQPRVDRSDGILNIIGL